MSAILLLVAEDHVVVRDGLVAILRREPGFQVVAEVSDGEAAVERIEALRPDVAVVDIGMPLMTGIEVARQVRDAGLRTAVVLLSMHKEPEFVLAGLEAGASGYVLKTAETSELIRAVHVAAAGDTYLSPEITSAAVALRGEAPRDLVELAPRERDVLRLLAEGLSSKEIASRLELTTRTVGWYRQQIMDKLDIRTVPGLVKYALRCHLTTLEE